uniref:Diacylglycerol lipase-alpha n=1 Tax=Strigamia maritima TaxID=126957 RepID=T1JB75_STRMM
IIILCNILAFFDFGVVTQCILDLHEHVVGYIFILSGCIVVEASMSWVSMKGTILYAEPRTSMEYLLYVRLGFMLVELAWLIIGVVWMVQHYTTCPIGLAKEAVLGIIVCNWFVLFSVLITIWCTFDAAGRSWVKMKRYQRSLKDGKTKFNYKRSGSTHRDWRQRKVMRAYQESWNTRCRMIFCCMGNSDQSRNSFAEIAKLLSDFFRDLDVVPSDVIAGLVLLRKFQKLERQEIIAKRRNKTYEFLSGIPITPDSKFLPFNDTEVLEKFKCVIHYMQYAISAYGWPMYVKVNSGTGICRLFPHLRCCCCFCCGRNQIDKVNIVEDNCCDCNYAALQKLCELNNVEIVYVTYHVEIGETPFFVAVDYERKKVVVSIRGTLSMQDILTDLNAEGEQLPTDVLHDDWLGHKGMVQAAEYIRHKMEDENILSDAFEFNSEKNTASFELVLVGHSLGAGTAAILAILLKDQYPDLQCYAYSPPGGLLSMPAVEYTKSFITSVVVGKDVVPRIGLHQMESLRSDLINAIQRSTEPKWKVITQSMMCCGTENLEEWQDANKARKESNRNLTIHPSDSSIALTAHQPLYPPGKIIHIVRHHSKKDEQLVKQNDPVYQAVWADNTDFDEVLISPVMIQDHMPDKVMEALQKVLSNVGPAKPQRVFLENEIKDIYIPDSSHSSPLDRTPPHKLCLETSFTDLNPESNRSSTYSEAGVINSEFPSALEDHLVRVFREQKNNFYSSNIGMPSRKVDLIRDEWMGFAPLASPETLSDVSSIGSKGSRGNLNNFKNSAKPMETIVQSPASSKTDNGMIYVEVPLDEPSDSEGIIDVTDVDVNKIAGVLETNLDLKFYVDDESPHKVSPKTDGVLEVHDGKRTGSTLSVSPRPISPREKKVTFQIDKLTGENNESKPINVDLFTSYDYTQQFPTPSPSGSTPTMDISVYQANLANAMQGLDLKQSNKITAQVPSPNQKQDVSPSDIDATLDTATKQDPAVNMEPQHSVDQSKDAKENKEDPKIPTIAIADEENVSLPTPTTCDVIVENSKTILEDDFDKTEEEADVIPTANTTEAVNISTNETEGKNITSPTTGKIKIEGSSEPSTGKIEEENIILPTTAEESPEEKATVETAPKPQIYNLIKRSHRPKVQEVQDEGKDAIDSPGSPTSPDLPPQEYILDEKEERSMIEPQSYLDPKLKELMAVLMEWINDELASQRIIIKDLEEDLYDGQVLQKLMEKLTGVRLDVVEVTQNEEGQKQKLKMVLDAVQKWLGLGRWSTEKWSVDAIHSKNLVAILHLLVSLARHFRAPVRLTENVVINLVVVQKAAGILQTRRVPEEITTSYDDLGLRFDRDAFDTLFDHAPDKLQVVKKSLVTFVNKHLNKINLEVNDLDTQFHDGVYLILLFGLLEGYFVPLHFFYLTPTTFEQKVHNVAFAFELSQDAGLLKPKARPEDVVNGDLKSTLRVLYNMFTKYKHLELGTR